LVCAGAVASIVSNKGRSALIAFVVAACFYVICVSTDSVLRQLLVGYWYNDAMRLAAIECECAVPLAALGLGLIVRLVCAPFTNLSFRSRNSLQLITCFSACVLAVFSLITPSHSYGFSSINDLQTAFSCAYGNWNRYSAISETAVSRVKDIVGNSLVLNDPYDGSCYAYGINDVRVYYRTNDFVNDEQDCDSQVIRTKLNEIYSNEKVMHAVRNLGAKYVIQLDPSNAVQREATEYNPDDWKGIDSIDETTDGFQLVAQSDSFRLFRIVGTD
jgi:hypothetical protein